MVRPRQPMLSRQRIIEQATAIIDAEGLEALSTRRLAAELDVRAPSLYNHFATKEEIIDAVGDAILGAVDISMFGRHEWPEAIALWARAYRAELVQHPNIVPLVAHGPARRHAQIRLGEAVYGALVDAGWPASYATRIGASMRYFVAGSALGSFALGWPDDPALYAGQYPHLTHAHRIRDHHQRIDEGAFELGLTTLVSGFVHLYGEIQRNISTSESVGATEPTLS